MAELVTLYNEKLNDYAILDRELPKGSAKNHLYYFIKVRQKIGRL